MRTPVAGWYVLLDVRLNLDVMTASFGAAMGNILNFFQVLVECERIIALAREYECERIEARE